jgi:hypothetical protein
MKKLFLVLAVVCFAAPSAWAGTITRCYSWEDGQTVLGTYPTTGITCTNVLSPVHTGLRALEIVRTSSTTTQAYVAWVKNLTTGDQVTGIFWAYDVTTGGNPSVRIWAHYGSSTDVTLAKGSASGPADYSGVPPGWGTVPNTPPTPIPYLWTFAPTDLTADALIIEVRSYGTAAGANTNWVDDITVTAPDRAGVEIVFPGIGGPSAVEQTTWGGIKALYQ